MLIFKSPTAVRFYLTVPTCFAAEHLLRTDPVEDKEGFFIALFVKRRNGLVSDPENETFGRSQIISSSASAPHSKRRNGAGKKGLVGIHMYNRMFKMLTHCRLNLGRRIILHPQNHRGDNHTL